MTQLDQLAVTLRSMKVVSSAERQPLSLVDQESVAEFKRRAVTVLQKSAARIIDALDVLLGDPDLEDHTGLEDAFEEHEKWSGYSGPGCSIADPDRCEDADVGEATNENGSEQEYAVLPLYGVDQTRGPLNEYAASAKHQHTLQ